MERKGEQNFFTSQMIKDCMKKVVTVTLHQSVKVRPAEGGRGQEGVVSAGGL